MSARSFAASAVFTILMASAGWSQPLAPPKEREKFPDPLSPQASLAAIHVPDDLVVELVASEPDVQDPIDLAAFRSFDQFQRIAWHWAEINRLAMESLAALPPGRTLFVRLEDLRQSPDKVQELFDFLGLPYSAEHFAVFARPHNVNKPEDRLLTEAQRAQFEAIAGPMMERLGYAGSPEYVVAY